MTYSTNYVFCDGELYHWGIKGMKWGRRRYQNKDGSLTPEGRKRYGVEDEPETKEQIRERVLKSTNAKEIYEHKDLLTTAEINERLNRIDTEARLSKMAEGTRKTGMDRVNDVLKVARKVDEVYSFVNNSSIGKAIEKKLKGEVIEKSKTLAEVYKLKDKMSDKELSDALKRANTERAIKKILDDEADTAKKAWEASQRELDAKKAVDDYNARLQKEYDERNAGRYNMKSKDINDSTWDSGKRSGSTAGLLEDKSVEKVTGEVIGEGTSKSKWADNSKSAKMPEKDDIIDDRWNKNAEWKDVETSSLPSTTVKSGMQYLSIIDDDRLRHSDDELAHIEWKDHKYIDKIKTASGKWRYIYEDTKASAKKKVDDTKQKIEDKKTDVINTVKEKAREVITGENNMYDVNWYNYDEKIAKIKETQEWKDIVARKDPEYVKTDANGNTQYLIDDYLVKKKHPELDVIDDIAYGRKVTVNKIEMDAMVASGKDYINTGLTVMGIASKALIEKFKFSQGAYADEINAAANDINNTITNTRQSINQYTSDAGELKKAASTVGTAANTAVNSARLINSISEQDMIGTVVAIANTPEGQAIIKAGSEYMIDTLRSSNPYDPRYRK